MKSVRYPEHPKGWLKKRICRFFVIDEASDFKFGTQLEFAKALHQIPPGKEMDVVNVAL